MYKVDRNKNKHLENLEANKVSYEEKLMTFFQIFEKPLCNF